MYVLNLVISDHRVSNVHVGSQVRENLRKWVTPPDPSTNHNLSSGIQHEGTAQWFFQGSMFDEWKSSGSLLWIYGKRTSFVLIPDPLLMVIRILSWRREERPVVSHR